jgi:hypothetical protein
MEKTMSNHEMIVSLFQTYLNEKEKFEGGNKSAGTRARKALSEVGKLTKEIRKEIQDSKNGA